MKKRKINPAYLRTITSHDVQDSAIDALDFALSIKEFAEEYLRGIVTVEIHGAPKGKVTLKLPVVSYLIRLFCENAKDDEMVEVTVSLDDELTMEVRFESIDKSEDAAHLISVAKLAGFKVKREDNTFFFTAEVKISRIMHIYAASSTEFKDMLITTHKM